MRVLRWTNGPNEAQNDHIQRTAHDIMIAQRTSHSTDSLQIKKEYIQIYLRKYILFLLMFLKTILIR